MLWSSSLDWTGVFVYLLLFCHQQKVSLHCSVAIAATTVRAPFVTSTILSDLRTDKQASVAPKMSLMGHYLLRSSHWMWWGCSLVGTHKERSNKLKAFIQMFSHDQVLKVDGLCDQYYHHTDAVYNNPKANSHDVLQSSSFCSHELYDDV